MLFNAILSVTCVCGPLIGKKINTEAREITEKTP